jgi:competence protein ComEC
VGAPLLPLALAWIAGLLISDWLALGRTNWLTVDGLLVLAVARARQQPPRLHALPLYGGERPRFALLLLLLIGALGGTRAAWAQTGFHPQTLASYNDSPSAVTISGTINSYPNLKGSKAQLQVAARTLLLSNGRELPIQGLVIATVSRYPEWHYGDTVRLRGQLVTPPDFPEFSYRDYLARRGIYSLLERASATRLALGQGSGFFQALYALRERARLTIAALLPEPHASLLVGILLGFDGDISEARLDRFNTTGTTHLLVISGANFAVIAGALALLTTGLAGPRRGLVLAQLGIWLYALLVGAEPGVLRAALMASIALLGRGVGRSALALNSLAAALLALTAWHPATLFDLGFQLSVLATLGLILLVPSMTTWAERHLQLLSPGHASTLLALLRDGVIVSLAAQLTTMPLIVATFGRLALLSLLPNLLVAPVQGWLMIGGALMTLAGLLWLPLGRLLAPVPWACLSWTVAVVDWAAQIPGMSLAVVGFNGPWLAGSYLLLLLLWLRATRSQFLTVWSASFALAARPTHLAAPALLAAPAPPPDPEPLPPSPSPSRSPALPPGAQVQSWGSPSPTPAIASQPATSAAPPSAPTTATPAPWPAPPPATPTPATLQTRRWWERIPASLRYGLAVALALLPWLLARYQPDGHLHLYLLDVGQGDGLLIVTPRGQQLVVDGGPEPQAMLAALGPRLPPWDRQLELLVLTHPDADHLGGLPELLTRYDVAAILHPGTQRETALFNEWEGRLASEQAREIVARRGQSLHIEPNLTLEVLHPGPTLIGDDGVNNDAVVLRLRYSQFCALLTGDIETEAETALVQAGVLSPCPVLKIAHHGSKTSSTDPFLARVRPTVALISVGADNRYGHPAPEIVERLAKLGVPFHRTDQRGTIEIISDGRTAWLRAER